MCSIRIERYKNGRFWAVYDNEQLVCITAYRRGALEVKRRLEIATSLPEQRECTGADLPSIASAESPRS